MRWCAGTVPLRHGSRWLPEGDRLKAYVLAAGYATRLGSLAQDRPKPLLDVGGRPVLSHTLDRLLELDDLTEVVVITNSRFHGQFEEWAATHTTGTPIRVLDDGSTHVDNRRGALADLAFGLELAPPDGEEWVVVAGDNLIDFDLRPLQEVFRSKRTPLLALRRLDGLHTSKRYNEVTVDVAQRVTRFREKPRDATSGLTAIALYFFTREVRPLLSRYLQLPEETDAPGHFIAWLVGEVPVHGTAFDGDWFDVGSPETLQAARDARAAGRGPTIA